MRHSPLAHQGAFCGGGCYKASNKEVRLNEVCVTVRGRGSIAFAKAVAFAVPCSVGWRVAEMSLAVSAVVIPEAAAVPATLDTRAED